MRLAEPSPSFRQPAAWLFAGAGLLLYLWAPSTLVGMDPGRGGAASWWIGFAMPPVVYGLVVARLPWLSTARQLAGIAALWATHALLGWVTEAIYAPTGLFPLGSALGEILWAQPAVPLLQILAVPLAVFPLRDLLIPRPRRRRVGLQPPRGERTPTPPPARVERTPTPPPARLERTPTPPPALPASPSGRRTLPERSLATPIFAPRIETTRVEPVRSEVAEPVGSAGPEPRRERRGIFEIAEAPPPPVPPIVTTPPVAPEPVPVRFEIPDDVLADDAMLAVVVDLPVVRAPVPEPEVESAPESEPSVAELPVSAVTVAEPPVPEPPVPPARETEPAVPAAPAPTPSLRPIHLAEARKIAAVLGRYGSLKVEAQVVMGLTLFTAASPRLAKDAVLGAAFRFLPLLAESPGPEPVSQATLRGAGGAVVLTPLGPVEAGGPVLVVAVSQRGALALLELLSLRIAGEYRGTHPELTAGGGLSDVPRPARPRLGDTPVPREVGALAASLDAFGPVAPSALSDAGGQARLYLFLAPGVDTARVGHVAWALSRATELDGEAGGITPLSSIVLRLGRQRVVVRPVAAAPGRTTLLVAAGGDLGRPGRAYRQIEQAAAQLAAG